MGTIKTVAPRPKQTVRRMETEPEKKQPAPSSRDAQSYPEKSLRESAGKNIASIYGEDSRFDKLRDPFYPDEIEWRVAEVFDRSEGKSALVLAYIKRRNVLERLDEVFGPIGWRNEYTKGPDGGVLCGISIWSSERGEWITKYDGGENTNISAVKGGLSDALKRAASQWGIGRYLSRMGRSIVPLIPAVEGGKKPTREHNWQYAPVGKGNDRRTFYFIPPRLHTDFLPTDFDAEKFYQNWFPSSDFKAPRAAKREQHPSEPPAGLKKRGEGEEPARQTRQPAQRAQPTNTRATAPARNAPTRSSSPSGTRTGSNPTQNTRTFSNTRQGAANPNPPTGKKPIVLTVKETDEAIDRLLLKYDLEHRTRMSKPSRTDGKRFVNHEVIGDYTKLPLMLLANWVNDNGEKDGKKGFFADHGEEMILSFNLKSFEGFVSALGNYYRDNPNDVPSHLKAEPQDEEEVEDDGGDADAYEDEDGSEFA
jgi:hypothetical protein